MDAKPSGNYVLLEVEPVALPGGIILPQNNKEFSRLRVIAVGPGKLIDDGTRVPPLVEVGEHVLVHELAYKAGRVQALTPELFDGRKLMLVDAGDIIGTVTGDVKPLPPPIVRGYADGKRNALLVH